VWGSVCVTLQRGHGEWKGWLMRGKGTHGPIFKSFQILWGRGDVLPNGGANPKGDLIK
jgi:hypothetical protein